MFVLIVGGGKVGLNTARQLMRLGHEIVLVEQRSSRFGIIAEELGDEALVFGDGTKVWVLEKAGIGRATWSSPSPATTRTTSSSRRSRS